MSVGLATTGLRNDRSKAMSRARPWPCYGHGHGMPPLRKRGCPWYRRARPQRARGRRLRARGFPAHFARAGARCRCGGHISRAPGGRPDARLPGPVGGWVGGGKRRGGARVEEERRLARARRTGRARAARRRTAARGGALSEALWRGALRRPPGAGCHGRSVEVLGSRRGLRRVWGGASSTVPAAWEMGVAETE